MLAIFKSNARGVFVTLFLFTLGRISSAQVEGKYELISNPEDPAYDAYLEALGVHEDFRIVMTKIKINIELEKAGANAYKYKIVTPLTTKETTFELGKESEDKYVDHRPFKTVFTQEGDVIKQELKFADGNSGTSEYKFSPSGIEVTQKSKDLTVVRLYRRT